MRFRVTFVAAASAGLLAATALAPATASPSVRAGLRPAILKANTGAIAITSPTAADGVGPGDYLLITRNDASNTQWICTANFVWENTTTKQRYLGAAGHCFLPSPDSTIGETRNPDRQTSDSQYVTKVEVCVSSCAFGGQTGSIVNGTFVTLGKVVAARQWQGNADNQLGNDFGMVEIPANLPIRTTVPVWGGPNKTSAPAKAGSPVCLYGNGGGVGETFATKARAGVSDGQRGGAWFADIPSFEGDSGSAVVNCFTGSGPTGLGILTHLTPFEDGVIAGTTIPRAIAMVLADNSLPIALA